MLHLTAIVTHAWALFVDAALYFAFGLLIAGLLHGFVKTETIARHLGANRLWAVVKAALMGVPLPLCSCGVLPAAIGLRKAGASKAATVSFLISTPESGVDSIAVTYALIDPLMAIIRPIAAFLTALVAGLAEILVGRETTDTPIISSRTTTTAAPACCHTTVPTVRQRLRSGLRYAFVDLLADITPTYLLGIGLGGLISYLIPTSMVEQYFGQGWSAMLMMLVVGIPMYICASASTPIAAALIMKGMSPGTALVFLLAGPATNITALPVIAKSLGWRSVAIYLGAIAGCALLFGFLTDQLYAFFAIDLHQFMTHSHHPIPMALRTGAAIGLAVLMLWVKIIQAVIARRPTGPTKQSGRPQQ